MVFSAVTTFLFLIGESMSCLVSKARDDLPDSMSQCDDVVYSYITLMTWSAVFAFVQLAIFPFMTSNYTKANLVRFDFAFREQAQLIFGGVSLSLSIFVFASSQDGGYDTDNGTLTSESARDSLNWSKCRAEKSRLACENTVCASEEREHLQRGAPTDRRGTRYELASLAKVAGSNTLFTRRHIKRPALNVRLFKHASRRKATGAFVHMCLWVWRHTFAPHVWRRPSAPFAHTCVWHYTSAPFAHTCVWH